MPKSSHPSNLAPIPGSDHALPDANHAWRGDGAPEVDVVLPAADPISDNDPQVQSKALWTTAEAVSRPATPEMKPVEVLAMGRGRTLTFAKVPDYAPRAVPGEETHSIPDYVEDFMSASSQRADRTYQNTVDTPDWQRGLYDLVARYLLDDMRGGGALAEHLGVESLDNLTPQQAVGLSLAVVRNLSKYTPLSEADDDVMIGAEPDSRADRMTAMELLEEGWQHKNSDSSWQGNGVCRNITSNVRAVFEALKACQGESSMLRNTYCIYKADDGVYVGERVRDPHAYAVFVTVDSTESASITVADATWGLNDPASLFGRVSKPIAHDMMGMDRTTPNRIAGILIDMPHGGVPRLAALARHFDNMLQPARDRAWVNKLNYDRAMVQLTGDFLLAVSDAMEAGIDWSTAGDLRLPGLFKQALSSERSAEDYSALEMVALHGLQAGGVIDFFDKAWARWLEHNTDVLDLADLFSTRDDALKGLAAAAVGDERLLQLASGDDFHARRLRAALQELRPDLFPAAA